MDNKYKYTYEKTADYCYKGTDVLINKLNITNDEDLFNAETPENLFAMAQSIVDKVEMGLIPDEQMEKTEQQLTVLLAAIQDKVLLKDLVLVPSQGGRGKA